MQKQLHVQSLLTPEAAALVARGEQPTEKPMQLCCQSNALPLSHPFTSYLPVCSFYLFHSRETAACTYGTALIRIARAEPRGVREAVTSSSSRGGANRCNFWMNFWLEQTERRSAECADENSHRGGEIQRVSAPKSLRRFVCIFSGRDGLCMPSSESVIFPLENADKVDINKGERALSLLRWSSETQAIAIDS